MSLSEALVAEFERRRAVNPRYSLRAFARVLGFSHSSISRLCCGRQPSARAVELLGRQLGWSEARIRATVIAQHVGRLRALASSRGFVADARWLASRSGLSLDAVQLALHEAVRTRRITMTSARAWTVET